MTKHFILSASGAEKWMNCPGAIRLEKGIPETTSEFAEEGTAAHSLAAECLEKGLSADAYLGEMFDEFEVDEEMAEAVQVHLDYINNLPGIKFFEQRVSYSPWVKGGFGTSDAIVIDKKHVTVIDYKHGKGIEVDVKNNPQLMIYALGVLNDYEIFEEFETFKLVIVQPRTNNISEWEISKADLLEFGEVVREKADIAKSENAPLNPGQKQCQWCRAKPICRALAEQNFKTAAEEFKDFETPISTKDKELLSINEISDILTKLDLIKSWTSSIADYALKIALRGETIKGFKVVEGRSNRTWKKIGIAEKALKNYLKASEMYKKTMLSPAQAEKALGKGHKIIDEHVIKPRGSPALVLADDKREPWNPAKLDFQEPINQGETNG